VTGSNAVNVFLGIGVAWYMAFYIRMCEHMYICPEITKLEKVKKLKKHSQLPVIHISMCLLVSCCLAG
jgi:predicted metal-binding protein